MSKENQLDNLFNDLVDVVTSIPTPTHTDMDIVNHTDNNIAIPTVNPTPIDTVINTNISEQDKGNYNNDLTTTLMDIDCTHYKKALDDVVVVRPQCNKSLVVDPNASTMSSGVHMDKNCSDCQFSIME